MKARVLAVCVLVCALVGVPVVGAAAKAKPPAKHHAVAKTTAKKKPLVKKKPVVKKKAFVELYDCRKIAPASLMTTLAGGWGGTWTLKLHGAYPGRDGGDSLCQFTQSVGYGGPSVAIYWGKKNAPFTYGGIKQTATIRGKQNCASRVANGSPVPTDPRQCAPVAIPGLGDKAFAMFDYVMVLRGSMTVMIAFPTMPDPAGNADPTQDLVVSVAQAILARIPVKPA